MIENGWRTIVGYDGSPDANLALQWAAHTALLDRRPMTVAVTNDAGALPGVAWAPDDYWEEIARSLLADQPVLVLDEPAAHLDQATATELAVEVLTGERDRSVLWITHGTAALHFVDRVVDLASAGHPGLEYERQPRSESP